MNARRVALYLVFVVLCLGGAGRASAFYNPGTGRWLSKNPIEERGGPNLYAAMQNSPLQYVDVNGLQASDIIKVVSGPDTLRATGDPLSNPPGKFELTNINGRPYNLFYVYGQDRPVAGAGQAYYDRLKDMALKEYKSETGHDCCHPPTVNFVYARTAADAASNLAGTANAGVKDIVLIAHGTPTAVTQLFFLVKQDERGWLGLPYDLSSIVPTTYPLGQLNVFSCHDKNLPPTINKIVINPVAASVDTNAFLAIAAPFKQMVKNHCNCNEHK